MLILDFCNKDNKFHPGAAKGWELIFDVRASHTFKYVHLEVFFNLQEVEEPCGQSLSGASCCMTSLMTILWLQDVKPHSLVLLMK